MCTSSAANPFGQLRGAEWTSGGAADGEPVRAEETGDLFRQGMLRVVRATGEAERKRPAEAISHLES